jgi:hypothetical protein
MDNAHELEVERQRRIAAYQASGSDKGARIAAASYKFDEAELRYLMHISSNRIDEAALRPFLDSPPPKDADVQNEGLGSAADSSTSDDSGVSESFLAPETAQSSSDYAKLSRPGGMADAIASAAGSVDGERSDSGEEKEEETAAPSASSTAAPSGREDRKSVVQPFVTSRFNSDGMFDIYPCVTKTNMGEHGD